MIDVRIPPRLRHCGVAVIATPARPGSAGASPAGDGVIAIANFPDPEEVAARAPQLAGEAPALPRIVRGRPTSTMPGLGGIEA